MDPSLDDERFAHMLKDPKFRKIPKSQRKIKIDSRFKSMFSDKKFTVKYTVDKRGRPVNQSSSENLKKYYELSESEDDTTETKPIKSKNKKKKEKKVSQEEDEENNDWSPDENYSSNGSLLLIKKPKTSDVDSENSQDDEDQENEKQLTLKKENETGKLTKEIKKKLHDFSVNYARGEGVLLSDSSSDEESSDEEDEEEDIEHNWGELDKEAETTNEATKRLALCNMDWDRIRAVDLMVLFNSFLPVGGVIYSITIYPSDFGLQRMAEEEVKGPLELVSSTVDENDIEDENEEGSNYNTEKLRKYQLNRLKYYYGVIECDSVNTASKIYSECDGMEYESTAAKLDLRFIPEDMNFENEPHEVCDKIPDLAKYQPRQFTTTALQQVKVDLTWDETNPERAEITKKLSSGKFDDLTENDLQAYLANRSSDEEEEEENVIKDLNDDEDDDLNPIDKYKCLLKSIEEEEEAKKKKDVELEFTWGLGEKEKSEKLVKEKLKKNENLTPFEQYLEKRKAKSKAKRDEKKETKQNESDDENSIPSDIDMNDPYFAEELKNTKPKQKKRKHVSNDQDANSEDDETRKQREAELELILMDDQNKSHFNMKKIEKEESLSKSKRKRLNKKKKDKDQSTEDNFTVNVDDTRFAALFTSHHFNIDPADPQYRKTKGTESLVKAKLDKRANDDLTVSQINSSTEKSSEVNSNKELDALVKSIKRNVKNVKKIK